MAFGWKTNQKGQKLRSWTKILKFCKINLVKKITAFLNQKNFTKLVLFVGFLLILINLLLLNVNLQQLQEVKMYSRVMGVTESGCPSSCLNVIPKKIYIPLGSGTINPGQNVWKNVGGTYINLADYPGVTRINWEAALRAPNGIGKVSARLVNATDNVEIWNSELEAEGSDHVFVSSPPLTFWQGTKFYRVQLKSSMGAEAEIQGARIVLTLR